ncbi:MAG: hypothetical protein E4G99_11865, partial [Anaerolineales bacterium]
GRQAPDLPEVSDVPFDPQSIAYEELKSASSRSPVVYLENGIPRGLLIDVKVSRNSAVERAQAFLKTYADLLRQDDPALALEVRRTSEVFAEQVVFYQTYKGIPVYAAEIIISLDGDRVFSTVGGLLRVGVDLDINPGLSNPAA